MDLNSGTVLKGAGSGQSAISCDSVCKMNFNTDGAGAVTLSGTFGQAIVGNLGSMLAFNGLTLAPSATITDVFALNTGSALAFSGALTAGASDGVSEIFTLRSRSVACLSNFTTSGTFSGARQFSVLNGSLLRNVSAVAIPGSAGIVTLTGYAAGNAPDGSGGNTGINAVGC